jgi:hypothetical protein
VGQADERKVGGYVWPSASFCAGRIRSSLMCCAIAIEVLSRPGALQSALMTAENARPHALTGVSDASPKGE